jgi:hypothetical protein
MIDQQHCTAAMNLVAIDVAEDWNVVLVHGLLGMTVPLKSPERS